MEIDRYAIDEREAIQEYEREQERMSKWAARRPVLRSLARASRRERKLNPSKNTTCSMIGCGKLIPFGGASETLCAACLAEIDGAESCPTTS